MASSHSCPLATRLDNELPSDVIIQFFQYGGSVAYVKLRTRHTKSPRKIVLLSHDTAYRPGGDRDEEKELISFLQLAKKSGYTFRTLDTFATDNVNV